MCKWENGDQELCYAKVTELNGVEEIETYLLDPNREGMLNDEEKQSNYRHNTYCGMVKPISYVKAPFGIVEEN